MRGVCVPKIGRRHSRAQKYAPEGRGAKTPLRKTAKKTGGLEPWGVGLAKFIRRTQNGGDIARGHRMP